MKRILGVSAVAAAVGLFAGFRAWPSAAAQANVQAGLATLFAINLLFGLWVWCRAKPGSGDAMLMPTIVILSASMLLGILPRVFWPAAGVLHFAGWIVSIGVLASALVMQLRRRRRLLQANVTVRR